MVKPSSITQWLRQPSRFSEKDRSSAAALIKAYPYFVPIRYTEAAEHHKKQPFAPAMMNMTRLYMGNWLLFHEFLNNATSAGTYAYEAPVQDTEDREEEELEASMIADEDITDYGGMDVEEMEAGFAEYVDEAELPQAGDASEDELIASEILEEQEEQPQAMDPGEEKPEAPVKQKTAETVKAGAANLRSAQTAGKPSEAAQVPKTPGGASETKETARPVPAETEEQIPFYQNRQPDSLIQPIYTEDYFLHQGLQVSDELPKDHKKAADKSLMVVMSFSEWLNHFKTKGEREKEEQQDQRALKTMWQKEKLAAALEEENDEIPETVFEMAVNSITKEEDLASESLAEIMVKQGKHDKAIDMYRKLSLRNPQKKAYFARKIDALQKEKES